MIIYASKGDARLFISPSAVLIPTGLSVAIYFLHVFVGYLLTRKLKAAGLIASFLVLGLFYIWGILIAILIIFFISLLLIKLIIKKAGF